MRSASLPLIFMLMLSITPVLAIEVPRFMAFWPLIIGLICAICWRVVYKNPVHLPRAYITCAAAISGLCLLSTLWSIAPENTFIDALKATAILGFGALFIIMCKTISTKNISQHLWLFPVGTLAASILCTVELATDMPLYQLLHGAFEKEPNTAVMNRGVVCTVFAYFISLLFLKVMPAKDRVHKLLAIALTLSIILMLSYTQSQSGQIALLLGVLTLCMIPHRFPLVYRLIGLCVVGGLVLTPFIAKWLYIFFIAQADDMTWLAQAYIGNRVEIWDFVSSYAITSPFLGHGMEATKYVEHFEHAQIYHGEDTVLHPHNFAIQIWMDFGFLGVLLASTFFYWLFTALSKTPRPARAYLLSVLVPFIIVAAVSYGMWQSWYVGESVFLCGLALIGARLSALKPFSKNIM